MLSGTAARRLRALELTLHGHRVRNQQLAGRTFEDPAVIVAWLGAVQSQDYAGAKWGLAQRGHGITNRAIDDAFDRGRILRTHMMRPTWHFVSPDDIRWVQSLTAPRVHAANGSMYRTLELDPRTLARSRRTIARALLTDAALTRPELQTALRRAGIVAEGHRLAYIVMDAELEQVICSGPRRGKQFTYVLLDRRAPHARRLDRDEALLELTRRYFTSHGPATVRDFSWWSGLTMKEAREGVGAAKARLSSETVADRTYWFVPHTRGSAARISPVYLLPNYDECLIAYKDRGSAVEAPVGPRTDPYAHHVLMGDCVVGSWRRSSRAAGSIDVHVHRAVGQAESRAIAAAGRSYCAFVEQPLAISVVTSSVA